MKAVENFLKPENCGQALERKTITNIKYYVAMVVSIKYVGGKEDIGGKLANIPSVELPDELLQEALTKVIDEFNGLGATDQVAKGSELVAKLLS